MRAQIKARGAVYALLSACIPGSGVSFLTYYHTLTKRDGNPNPCIPPLFGKSASGSPEWKRIDRKRVVGFRFATHPEMVPRLIVPADEKNAMALCARPAAAPDRSAREDDSFRVPRRRWMPTSMVTRETIIPFWWAGVGVGEARRSRCRERRSHEINAFDPATRSVRNVKKAGFLLRNVSKGRRCVWFFGMQRRAGLVSDELSSRAQRLYCGGQRQDPAGPVPNETGRADFCHSCFFVGRWVVWKWKWKKEYTVLFSQVQGPAS
jgi:hypothetical protein